MTRRTSQNPNPPRIAATRTALSPLATPPRQPPLSTVRNFFQKSEPDRVTNGANFGIRM
jgi:hypothetical protein